MSLPSAPPAKQNPPDLRALLSYLLDRSADLGGRDDVAMDLWESDDPEAEAALIQLALDHTENVVLIDSAGESLRSIWERKGKLDQDVVARMHPAAQRFFRVDSILRS
jgi:hypothetical protein